MLRRLVELALSARLAVIGTALVLAVAGWLSYRSLPIDAYPDMSPVQVLLILKSPGMTPEEVEKRATRPIETDMLGIPKQQTLRSTSKYGIATFTIDFDPGTDLYWARQQVNERLTTAKADLPASVTGGLAPIATPLSDVLMFTVEGPQSLIERRTILEWTIRPQLRTVKGVADVNMLGGKAQSFVVKPDTAALAMAGMTISNLADAIKKGNQNGGAGRLTEGEQSLIVRTMGAVTQPSDIAQIIVRDGPAGVARVGDFATVELGSLTRSGAVTESGRGEAVEGLVVALIGSNAKEVVAAASKKLQSIELPPDTHVHIFYNREMLVKHAVSTVRDSLLEAAIIVVVLLLIYLANWRAALIVAVTLPMSALITFILMKLFGLSANIMSLGGLAIAIGVLVDGSIVVLENVVERLNDPDLPEDRRIHRVFQATGEVIQPVGAGIIIIALVFTPLLTLQGLGGKLFAPVAITIVFALLGSLLCALTLVPVLAAYAIKRRDDDEAPWIMRKIRPGYSSALNWSFDHKWMVYIATGLLFGIAILAYNMVGKTFLPTLNEGSMVMQLTKLPTVSLAHSLQDDLAIQRALIKNVPEITSIVARTGSDQLGLDPMSLNQTDSYIQLKPKKDWRKSDPEWLRGKMRDVMRGIPGVNPIFTQPIEMRIADMMSGGGGQLTLKIFGDDEPRLADLAAQMRDLMKKTKGSTDVSTTATDQNSYLQLDVNRLEAGRVGLSVSDFEDALQSQLEGLDAGTARVGIQRIPIMIKGDDTIKDNPQLFQNLPLRTASGDYTRVSDMARVSRQSGPLAILHEGAERYAMVQASVSGRDLVGFVDELKKNAPKLPSGYHYDWAGQYKNQQETMKRLAIVVPMAIVAIFLVLFLTLRSLRGALLILVNMPFALVGGIIALLVTRAYLSVPASVGFIALLGIAVLNGLVLVTFTRDLRADGHSLKKAVREGAERRLRPVLMTASITAIGLVPVLFSSGPGSEIQRPLAIVVIGGLITSTVLTLILLPILYERFGESKEARKEDEEDDTDDKKNHASMEPA